MQVQKVKDLSVSDVTSTIYTIAPTQVEYISRIFADNVADMMNMRAFASKIRTIAENALRNALNSARHMGE